MGRTNVAIIGAGPRGLWAAEALMERARQRGVSIALTVFNDGPVQAASAAGAFQPDLPHHWLLNVPSQVIRTQLGSFNAWRGADDPFPPRRLVGEFLQASWRAVAEQAPPQCEITMCGSGVTDLSPAGAGGGVHIAGEHFDEVLVATGHAEDWPGRLRQGDVGDLPVIAPVYPAAHLDTVGEADVALVRGAALTFIDVVRYAKAQTFYPVTRSGRFMEVKAYLDGQDKARVAPVLAEAAQRIRQCDGFAELEEILAGCAATILHTLGGQGGLDEVLAVLRGEDFTGDAVDELRTSLAAAEGSRAWTPALAVALAFRETYDALVDRASFGGRETLGGDRFDRLTRTLERVAFGPPAQSARDLLEMIDAGRIRTDVLDRGEEDLGALAAEVGATVVIDAVNAPPGVVEGTLIGELVARGIGQRYGDTNALHVERDATLVGQHHIAAAGRMNEGFILGHDTLRRGPDDVIERWADRVSAAAMEHPDRVHGLPPLAARTFGWSEALVNDAAQCRHLIDTFGSPANVLNPEPMEANIAELVTAGEQVGVETKIFFARKANKALVFVDTVRDTGHGVDVASENELRQVLDRGMPGERIVLSAAIKPDRLLALAIDHGVNISTDTCAEYDRVCAIAEAAGTYACVAPRLAPNPDTMPPTRFGERLGAWAAHVSEPRAGAQVVGVHAHLHGYAAQDRSTALRECMELIDALRAAGHAPEFIDIGGGVPMSYLSSEEQWRDYQDAIAAQRSGYATALTWKADPLTNTYPYWQEPTRGAWLTQVLAGGVAEELRARGLRLHLEPGRSLLDGCGVILADVAFTKTRSDGVPLVGLAMNRTQCRTTSDDYLIDPVLIKRTPAGDAVEAFLVGAYCIEDELILRRKIRFPRGVAAGDIVAIPNAAGYFMHILESASHQIPLAHNVVYPPGVLDDIDGQPTARR